LTDAGRKVLSTGKLNDEQIGYLIQGYVKDICVDLTYVDNSKNPPIPRALQPNLAANKIIEDSRIKIQTDIKNDFVYTFTPNVGIYTPFGKQTLELIISNGFGVHARSNLVSETLYFIKVNTRNQKEISNRIAVTNGILNVTANDASVDPFTPDEFITSKLPVSFDKNATNPLWVDFIQKACPNGYLTLQEWFGYCLVKDYRIHKMMTLYGTTGREGKGTTIRTVENIYGDENVSNIPLEPLADRKDFVARELRNKLINTSPEPKTNRGLPIEFLKSATGEDSFDANEKYVQGFTKMKNTAKITLMLNRMPNYVNPDPALIRR
jgi:putative DNA primase/helicase